MKTFLVVTHRQEEIEWVPISNKSNFIDTHINENRLIVLLNNSTLPKLEFSKGEYVIVLEHGSLKNIVKNYGSNNFSFIYACGTEGSQSVSSDNRKHFIGLLKNPMEKFNEAWEYFDNFLLEEKLKFLHSIYEGADTDLPRVLNKGEVKTYYDAFKDNAYNKDNPDDTIIKKLTLLRDEVMKVKG